MTGSANATVPAVPPSPVQLEELAVELATGAADVVRAARGSALDVSAKSTATDLVTATDRATESWLRGELARLRPDDAVLGEESGAEAGTSAVRWVIDPIDGTVNFVLGLPQYAVSIAAEVDGRTVAGAVLNPASGELFRAHLGGGAYLGSTRLRGPRGVELARAVVGTGFAYAAQRRQRQAAVVARLLPDVADIRRLGSASLDLCAVAAGRLDAYFEAGLNPWDYAAGLLIATEAGCATTGLRDREPGPTMAAVARPELLTELTALLESLDADRV
ncbi:MAG TPA: inositol monophosphatase family protein [Jatrophihabitantaceae bacterium]|nr:inositol monophosphatase family protein [Jatrophihabitantaceae bacterium]